MDNEKIEERLARLERLENMGNRTVKLSAFEQFILRIASALILFGCLIAVIFLAYWAWLASKSDGNHPWVIIALIAIPFSLIYSLALFVVFQRVHIHDRQKWRTPG